MGILKNPMIGIPSGKVGEFIIRHRYGKEVIYSKPKKYKITKSVPLKNARRTFSITVELAKIIKTSGLLNDVWKFAVTPGKNSYTKILKANIKMSDPDKLTLSNDITPDMRVINYHSLALESFKVNLKPEGLLLEYSIYKNDSYDLTEYPVYIEIVIFAHNPLSSFVKKKHFFVASEERLKKVVLGKKVKHLLSNKSIHRNTLNEFKDAIVYFAIVKPDLPGSPPLWSWTASRKVVINK